MRGLRVSMGRRLFAAGVLFGVALPAAVTLAQDPPKPEDLQKAYQEALAQLKAAQDRRSELATENARLAARVAELERQLQSARRELYASTDQTYFFRSHYAAWQAFIKSYPALAARWTIFLEADLLSPPNVLPELLLERDWSAAATSPVATTPLPATVPATAPAPPVGPTTLPDPTTKPIPVRVTPVTQPAATTTSAPATTQAATTTTQPAVPVDG